jgi:hypothetical protein
MRTRKTPAGAVNTPGAWPIAEKERMTMRSLLALVLGFLRAALGKSLAETASTAPKRPVPIARRQRVSDVIEADFLLVVRPYPVVHDQAPERWGRRERRRAALPAVVGQDDLPAVTE